MFWFFSSSPNRFYKGFCLICHIGMGLFFGNLLFLLNNCSFLKNVFNIFWILTYKINKMSMPHQQVNNVSDQIDEMIQREIQNKSTSGILTQLQGHR